MIKQTIKNQSHQWNHRIFMFYLICGFLSFFFVFLNASFGFMVPLPKSELEIWFQEFLILVKINTPFIVCVCGINLFLTSVGCWDWQCTRLSASCSSMHIMVYIIHVRVWRSRRTFISHFISNFRGKHSMLLMIQFTIF